MTHKEYNGWTNYETWLIKLWMDNEQHSQEYWQSEAEDTYEQACADTVFTRSEKARSTLAETLNDQHEEAALAKTGDNGWVCDLVTGALSEVNWIEIADALLHDVDEYEPMEK